MNAAELESILRAPYLDGSVSPVIARNRPALVMHWLRSIASGESGDKLTISRRTAVYRRESLRHAGIIPIVDAAALASLATALDVEADDTDALVRLAFALRATIGPSRRHMTTRFGALATEASALMRVGEVRPTDE